MSGFIGKYKIYIDDLTAILDASSEIIFLCNNFDITRIHDLFINIIENYNYYEEGKNETSNTEPLGEEISGSAEYIKMKEYIDKNFVNIKDKCECFTKKLGEFITHNLPDNAEIQDSSDDALIRDNFKSQYKTIRINLEDIERELGKIKKITENDIKAIKDDDIQFNIFPITKSNMMYSSGLYSSFKMIFKNLQIIDSNENEITEQELDEINNDLKKLYINLIEKFNKDTINAQESVLKDIIAALTDEGSSLKDKYDSYIKKGGDVKDEEGEGEGDGEDGKDKVEGKEGKGNVEGKEGKGKGEGNGENVKNLEEEAERLTKEAEEAKKKADELNELAEEAKLKEGNDEEENLKYAEEALVAATAARDAAKVASDAKKAADKAKLAAAAAAEEEAERKKKVAEDAKKKADEDAKKRAAAAAEEERKKEEAAEEERKKEEAAKKKKKDEEEAAKKKIEDEEEAAKKKIEDEEEAAKKKKKDEEKTLVLNFEYNNHSCYIDSVLQMLIDNDELCVKIVNAAKDKTLETKFNKDALTEVEKTSDEYLLYLLYKIIIYHRKERHPIGDSKKPSYNDYILPLRNYLYGVKPGTFRQSAEEDVDDFLNFVLEKLSTLEISTEYDETKILFLKNDNNKESFEEIIKYQDQDSAIISNKENLIFKIGRSRNIRGDDGKYLMENNKIKTEIVRKPITLSPKLVLGEGTTKTTYILKGFIHYDPGHYIYYKSLNNSGNEWVILDDRDTGTNPNSNEKHEVIGHPLGKNGKIISQENIETTGSTLFYYKKEKDNTLNASPEGVEKRANTEEDDPELQAAQPVGVANATESPFKYSFETLTNAVNRNTPIYNSSDKPYYLNRGKTNTAKFMASLNAGDNDLYVGGSQINHAFNCAISGENINKSKNDEELNALSIEMHTTFYTVVNSTPGIPGDIYKYDDLQSNHNSNIYFEDMYLYKSEKLLDKFKFENNIYPGDVFIEILKDNSWINGGGEHINNMTNKANKAMIYCVGPQGDVFKNAEDVEDEFLKAILIVGKNIANAINKYNKYDGNDNKKIDYVRICLISGNLYLPKSMKSDKLTESQVKVAEALIKGIHSVNKEKGVKDIVYNFAYADDAFQKAFDKLKNTQEYTNDTTFIKLNIT